MIRGRPNEALHAGEPFGRQRGLCGGKPIGDPSRVEVWHSGPPQVLGSTDGIAAAQHQRPAVGAALEQCPATEVALGPVGNRVIATDDDRSDLDWKAGAAKVRLGHLADTAFSTTVF